MKRNCPAARSSYRSRWQNNAVETEEDNSLFQKFYSNIF
jgi:hypothetical protein